jgi:hypothetical protein
MRFIGKSFINCNSNVSAFLIHMYISSFQELGSGEKSRATVEEER